jgi:hypothetical protein
MSLLSGRNESTAILSADVHNSYGNLTVLCIAIVCRNPPQRAVKVGNPDTNIYVPKYSAAFTAPI